MRSNTHVPRSRADLLGTGHSVISYPAVAHLSSARRLSLWRRNCLAPALRRSSTSRCSPSISFYGSGPNVVANQAAGGAIMDVSGQVVFTTAILICLGFWLRDDERKEALQAEGMPSETQANISARGALLIAEADLAESSEQSSRN